MGLIFPVYFVFKIATSGNIGILGNEKVDKAATQAKRISWSCIPLSDINCILKSKILGSWQEIGIHL